jgi:hypothetical protein
MQQDPQEENVVSDLFDNYQETQKEILDIEIKKVRNKLFTLAIIFFISDLLQLIASDLVNPTTILVIAVIPLLFVGLGFLAIKEPLLAMVLCAVIIGGIWIYVAVVTGGRAALSGLLVKGMVVYLVIAGFQSANEAHKIKKELKG